MPQVLGRKGKVTLLINIIQRLGWDHKLRLNACQKNWGHLTLTAIRNYSMANIKTSRDIHSITPIICKEEDLKFLASGHVGILVFYPWNFSLELSSHSAGLQWICELCVSMDSALLFSFPAWYIWITFQKENRIFQKFCDPKSGAQTLLLL